MEVYMIYLFQEKLNKLPSKINLNYFYEEKKDKINNYNLKINITKIKELLKYKKYKKKQYL